MKRSRCPTLLRNNTEWWERNLTGCRRLYLHRREGGGPLLRPNGVTESSPTSEVPSRDKTRYPETYELHRLSSMSSQDTTKFFNRCHRRCHGDVLLLARFWLLFHISPSLHPRLRWIKLKFSCDTLELINELKETRLKGVDIRPLFTIDGFQ